MYYVLRITTPPMTFQSGEINIQHILLEDIWAVVVVVVEVVEAIATYLHRT